MLLNIIHLGYQRVDVIKPETYLCIWKRAKVTLKLKHHQTKDHLITDLYHCSIILKLAGKVLYWTNLCLSENQYAYGSKLSTTDCRYGKLNITA